MRLSTDQLFGLFHDEEKKFYETGIRRPNGEPYPLPCGDTHTQLYSSPSFSTLSLSLLLCLHLLFSFFSFFSIFPFPPLFLSKTVLNEKLNFVPWYKILLCSIRYFLQYQVAPPYFLFAYLVIGWQEALHHKSSV